MSKNLLVFVLSLVFILLFLPSISAQVTTHRTISFKSDCATYLDFIDFIKKDRNLKFYYDPEWFESRDCVNVNFIDKDVNFAIQEFFAKYNFQVFLQGNNVFISNTMDIDSGFTDYFSKAMVKVRLETSKEGLSAPKEERKTNEIQNQESEIIRFGMPTLKLKDTKFHLTGLITEVGTQVPVIGATVQIGGTTLGAITNLNGKYDILVPAGQYEVIYRAIGKLTASRQVSLYSDGIVNLSLTDEPITLEEVKVVAKRNDRVNMMVGAENLDISMMKKSILALGEPDVIKGILTLPGVQTTNEISTGFNVRGGGTDQNLVLIDNIPVMNATHFFGFFSVFNSDMIEKATLYKSGIPSSLGGRISSIFDITSQTGSKEKFNINGGISPFTGRLGIDGPIIKEKLSFNIGVRSTYSDWVLKRITDPRINKSSASFYDILANLHYAISKKQQLKFTFYKSEDFFKFDQISSNNYSNLAYSLNYEVNLTERLKFSTYATFSSYNFGIIDESILSYAKESVYEINQKALNAMFSFNKNNWINLNYGLSGILYNTQPGIVTPFGTESLILSKKLEPEKAFEGALFISNEQDITNWLSILYGIRYSGIGNFGPKTVFDYAPDYSKSISTISDTLYFASNRLIKQYSGFEPRFLARIKTGPKSSVKLSYSVSSQYINLISNTITAAPTDIWKLSDIHFVPQSGQQLSIGYFKDFISRIKDSYSVSLEAYYKKAKNIVDYKVGAELFSNEHFETEIINGENLSYGFEIQLVKESGSLNGWINYSFSRSLNRFNNSFPEEVINFGDYYPANYDKPHNLKAVLNYDFYKRLRFSMNINYSNGRPVTYPQTAFMFGESKKIQFSERNQYRLPDHFRVDIAATFEGNYKLKKLVHGSFTFSVINVTGRRNPYSVLFQYDRFRKLKAYYLSIFGVPIPSLTYNFKF